MSGHLNPPPQKNIQNEISEMIQQTTMQKSSSEQRGYTLQYTVLLFIKGIKQNITHDQVIKLCESK